MSTEINLFVTNNNTNSPINQVNLTEVPTPTIPTPSSSIFTSPSNHNHYSNRDEFNEFFNTTELLAMDLTLSPSPPITTTPLSTNSPTSSPKSNWSPTISTNNNQTQEQLNFTEFIAFISWYAFLILCCFIPTICAYQRRRRNARILQASLETMQRRLEELDRMGGLDSLRMRRRQREVEATMQDDDDRLDLGENNIRQRDWEFLEALFGGAEGEGGTVDRRSILAGMLSGMSVRMLVEREERKRRERRSKLLAALKETSMEVKECHMIANDPPNEPLSPVKSSQHNGHLVIDVKEGGDDKNSIESEATTERLSKDQTTKIVDVSRTSETVGEDEKLCSKPLNLDDETQLNNASTMSLEEGCASNNEESKAVAAASALQPQHVDNADTLSSIEAGEATSSQQLENTIPLSLYEVHDSYIDDDDNPYSALCIPCKNEYRVESNTTAAPQSQPQSTIMNESRLVPPTCAICLIPYEPGCYVTWSQQCIHVFHRDCILMWLLKKDEPLCPCCRQEFASGLGSQRDSESSEAGLAR